MKTVPPQKLSFRRSGNTGEYGPRDGLGRILDAWRAEHAEGVACVISAASLDESCLPETFDEGMEGAVDRDVAMTRATQRLVVLTSS